MHNYQGSCHCGTVRYEVKLDLDKVYACNCSICQKRGMLITFASGDDFTLLQGGDNLQDYLFHKKVIHHHFCKTCGVESFAEGKNPDGSPAYGINVRCLDDVDVAALETIPLDGRSF